MNQEVTYADILQLVDEWTSVTTVERSRWSEEENARLEELYMTHGKQWRRIAIEMGRTDDAVRQRFGRQHPGNAKVGCKLSGVRERWPERDIERLVNCLQTEDANVFMELRGAYGFQALRNKRNRLVFQGKADANDTWCALVKLTKKKRQDT